MLPKSMHLEVKIEKRYRYNFYAYHYNLNEGPIFLTSLQAYKLKGLGLLII
jgi:hypothetical protein